MDAAAQKQIVEARLFTPITEEDLLLSPDQQAAEDRIVAEIEAGVREVSLVGPAGTGKTYLLRSIARRLRDELGRTVEFMAPTWKAAMRLRELTGEKATSIHGRLYAQPREEGKCPTCQKWSPEMALTRIEAKRLGVSHRRCPKCGQQIKIEIAVETKLVFDGAKEPCDEGSVLVCDESSMVGTAIYEDLLRVLPPGAVILFCGDREQLPPVEGAWGPDFDHPTAALAQLHRQAQGNPIIQVATQIRNKQGLRAIEDWKSSHDDRLVAYTSRAEMALANDAATWLARHREANSSAALITYTNADRRLLNALTRRARGIEARCSREKRPLTAGDRVLISTNNKTWGFYNSEVYTVASAEWAPEELRNDPGIRANTILDLTFEESAEHEDPKDGDPLRMRVFAHLIGQPYSEFRDTLKPFWQAWARYTKDWYAETGGNTSKETMDQWMARHGFVDPSRFLHVEYGEALTVHRSQADQWDHVGFFYGSSTHGLRTRDPETWRRLFYTAVTRAAEIATLFYMEPR